MFVKVLILGICVRVCAPQRSVPAAACEVRLRTESGVACGRVRVAESTHTYASFRGLPYGAPPTGNRRFADLAPVEPWSGLLDAREDGAACPQTELIYGRMTLQPRGQSEDCLQLNVHVPYYHFSTQAMSKDTKGLPIVVMLHGGGFYSGSGLSDVHGPEYLMATESVIVVTMNFRINVFGYLTLGTAKVPGNQGLRDAIHALRWVQRHARAFGGNPDNVTLMGQSCGASMVHLLSLSKAAEGLFHRIFLMSGHAIPIYFTTDPQFGKQIMTDFVELLGINSTDPDYIHDALTQLPLVDIMYANSIILYNYGLTTFSPVVEQVYPGVETVLEEDPLKLIAEGRGTQYPMLLGYTTNEAEFFKWVSHVWQLPRRVKENPTLVLPPRIAYHHPNEIESLANKTIDGCFHGDLSLENFVECYSYLFFKYPMLKIAEWRSLGGAPAYLYRYSYESIRSVIKEALWATYHGAAHVEDLTYIFRTNSMMGDHVSFPPQNDDDRMREWWVTIVTNFAICGNPTCTIDEEQWPPVTSPLQYQDIGRPMEFHMKYLDGEEADWVRFFDGVDEEVRKTGRLLKKNLNFNNSK